MSLEREAEVLRYLDERELVRRSAGKAVLGSRVVGANDKVVLGVIGIRGQGDALKRGFARIPCGCRARRWRVSTSRLSTPRLSRPLSLRHWPVTGAFSLSSPPSPF